MEFKRDVVVRYANNAVARVTTPDVGLRYTAALSTIERNNCAMPVIADASWIESKCNGRM